MTDYEVDVELRNQGLTESAIESMVADSIERDTQFVTADARHDDPSVVDVNFIMPNEGLAPNVVEQVVEETFPDASEIDVQMAETNSGFERTSRGQIEFDHMTDDAFEDLVVQTLETSDFIEVEESSTGDELVIYELTNGGEN